jgi:hypothetical protein
MIKNSSYASLNPYFQTHYTFNGIGNICKCTPPALPLSKTNNINTSQNNSAISCRMRYAQVMRNFGTTQATTSYAKKTCSIGGPTFSY